MNYDTSKIDEWTLEICREDLANIRGWTFKYGSWWNAVSAGMCHPIPATLDESSKLPEGWVLRSYVTYLCHCEAIAEYFPKFDEAPSMQITASTSTKTDERLVRFRLRCKVESLTVRAEGEVTK